MAKVHHLFYSSDADKQTLHRRIVPNQDQQQLQQERWNELRDYLIADLEEKSGYKISSWLQGSYKFGTQVRPVSKQGEFDIDLGIYFNWPGEADGGEFSPKALKTLVQESLLRYREGADDVEEVLSPPKERCARIRFQNNFHIDVPAYHLDADSDTRKLATENHGWEHSDPKALYKWFLDNFSDEESSQVRRLIRYVKVWSTLKLAKPPSSVLLTVLVSEAYLNQAEDVLAGDDLALLHVSREIHERLEQNRQVLNPVDMTEDLNRLDADEHTTLVGQLAELTDIAEAAIDAATEFDAASMWTQAFHQFFPVPEAVVAEAENRAIVPVAFEPKVHVEAVAKSNKARRFTGENRIGPIPRDCDIFFTLMNADALPPGARVQWVVRNEGDEAEYKNDLGHMAGNSLHRAEEKSAYRGTHYMDVAVTSAIGQVIGFRRIPVEISGSFMPPRNPKKPGYTKIPRHH